MWKYIYVAGLSAWGLTIVLAPLWVAILMIRGGKLVCGVN